MCALDSQTFCGPKVKEHRREGLRLSKFKWKILIFKFKYMATNNLQ